MAKPTIKKMLSLWESAWSQSDKSSPYSGFIESELNKSNISTYDIKTQIGLIRMKKEFEQDEIKLLDFYSRCLHMKEQILNDRVSQTTAGQIFLLKATCGYKDQNMDINITKTEAVVEFGS